MMNLLGLGITLKGVTLSNDELRNIRRLYDTHLEDEALAQAGADRNILRHAESDGLRMLAWISKFMSKGEDPLRTLIQFAVEAGIDVSTEDFEWAATD